MKSEDISNTVFLIHLNIGKKKSQLSVNILLHSPNNRFPLLTVGSSFLSSKVFKTLINSKNLVL